MLQDQADAGKTVLQDKIPNSGTTDRALNTAAMGAIMFEPMTAVSTLGGMGLLGLPATTSKHGKNMLTGDTKTQMLLKKLRADRLAESAGLPISQAVEGLFEDQ
jgi:hypothetical protein